MLLSWKKYYVPFKSIWRKKHVDLEYFQQKYDPVYK